MAVRVRRSLQELERLYRDNIDRSQLENVVRAFAYLQSLPPDDPNSFFHIGGFHGEPFRGPGAVNDDTWWGGYCNHSNVLFPTWHRALLLRLENALRTAPGCEDVTLPYWDEAAEYKSETPVPKVLTDPTFSINGVEVPNPLYSYKLQRKIDDNRKDNNNRYSKHAGYETVRYPKSGLVGTDADRKATEIHNEAYADPDVYRSKLNQNIWAWLSSKPIFSDDEHDTPTPDVSFTVYEKIMRCLKAPEYTVFSNKTSATAWNKTHALTLSATPADSPLSPHDLHSVTSLEDPHNSIHLAVGGFYQEGVYNADPILGANGDMGDNETASFDPIFFMHHAFIDYVFWKWQERHNFTAAGSITIRDDYPGTVLDEGGAGYPRGTVLDMNTPLYPFKHADRDQWYTSHDVVDIVGQLGYTYGQGSLDILPSDGPESLDRYVPELYAVSAKVNRTKIEGSFIIRTFAKNDATNRQVELQRDTVLSRRYVQGCQNCHNNLLAYDVIPVSSKVVDWLHAGDRTNGKIEYDYEIQTRQPATKGAPKLVADQPEVTIIRRGGYVTED